MSLLVKVSWKMLVLEASLVVASKSVKQELSWQECPARVSSKSVQQECEERVSSKSSGVSCKSVQQECQSKSV